MKDSLDSKRLDDLLSDVTDLRAQPDFDQWRRRHPKAVDALKARPFVITNRRNRKMMIRITRFGTIAAAILVLVIASLAVPTLFWPSSATLFAQVREQLDSVHTFTFDVKLEVEGQPTVTLRQMMRNDVQMRQEHSDGKYVVSEHTEDTWTRMDVDPAEKTARITHRFPRDLPFDITLNWFRDLPESAGASPVDARTIEGRSCPGFLINLDMDKAGTQQMRLWIDPETRLPIYSVVVAERKRPGGGAPKDPGDSNRATATCSNFKYDVELDDSLFSLTPPEGYAVTTRGTPQKRRSAQWPAEKLLLTVGEGIGPAKFGMSKEQVVKLLGEPEEKGEAKQLVGRTGATWKAESWYYNSQGLRIGFSSLPEPGGLSSITCRPGNFRSRGFQGKTSEGIGLGSSPEDVRRAYGYPTEEQPFKDGLGAYRYPEKGFRVGFVDGVVYQLQIERPRKKKPAAKEQGEE